MWPPVRLGVCCHRHTRHTAGVVICWKQSAAIEALLTVIIGCKTLFRGWPVMAHETHMRRRRLVALAAPLMWYRSRTRGGRLVYAVVIFFCFILYNNESIWYYTYLTYRVHLQQNIRFPNGVLVFTTKNFTKTLEKSSWFNFCLFFR